MSDSKPILTNGIYKLTPQMLRQVKQLLVDGFKENNPIWKSFDMKKQQIQEFFDKMLQSQLQAQERSRLIYGKKFTTDYVYFYDNKLMGSFHNLELEEYKRLRNIQKIQTLQAYKSLQKAGIQLIKDINFDKYPPGTAFYSSFGASSPKHILPTLGKIIVLIELYKTINNMGIRWILTRQSSRPAHLLYLHLGGVCLKQTVFINQGKQFPLYFLQLDLQNPVFVKFVDNLDKLKQQLTIKLNLKSKL